jgi:uroporphyrinogen III methyltransferase/synthase
MGMRNLPSIVRSLLDEGKPPTTPVALIRWGTRSAQRTVTGTLQDIVKISTDAGIDPPAIIVIGEVVTLRDKLNWYERRPLFGKKVMVTRALSQAKECSDLLYDYGAETIECPTIEMIPPADTTALHRAIDNIEQYDWAVFTSVNGVTYFMRHLHDRNQDLRVLHNLRICCIGPRTAQELRKHGLIPDVVPETFQAEGVIDALAPLGLKGKRVLIPRAEVARDVLPDTLRSLGAEVTVPAVYRTIQPGRDVTWAMEMLRGKEISVITFTSSSTVRNFVDLFGGRDRAHELLSSTAIASIGPITSGTVKEFGLTPTIVAKENTIPALVDAIVEFYRTRRRKRPSSKPSVWTNT